MSDITPTSAPAAPTAPAKPAAKLRGARRTKAAAPAAGINAALQPDSAVGTSPEKVGEVFRQAMAEQQGQAPKDDAKPAADPAPKADAQPDLEAELGALLGDDDVTEPAPAGKTAEKPARPSSLAELAEQLEVEQSELYGLEVPMPGDADPVTLGALKDAWQASADHALEREQWENTRQAEQNDIRTARQELALLAQAVPENMRTPAMVEAAAAQLEQVRERETAAALKAVPEWKDQTAYQADREVMLQHLKGYGFSEGDLDSVADHRLMVYVRAQAKREQRLREALERAQASKRTGAAPTRRPQNSNAPSAPARQQRSNTSSKVAEVGAILKGL